MALQDTDVMPWGKHKGEKIANVPAAYLFWLYDQARPKAPNKRTLFEKDLVKYVDENRDVLNKEIKK